MSTASNLVETTAVNDFQRMLNDRRRQRGIRSISELARRAGLPYSTTRRILLGPMVLTPKQEQLEGLAKALNWPLEFVQQAALEVNNPGLKLYVDHAEDLQVVMASWGELSERDRRTIVRMVEELRRENGG